MLPVIFENFVVSTSPDIFLKTIPNPSEHVPTPLPYTSQDIPKIMKKLSRTNLGGDGNQTGGLPNPGPGTKTLQLYGILTSEKSSSKGFLCIKNRESFDQI